MSLSRSDFFFSLTLFCFAASQRPLKVIRSSHPVVPRTVQRSVVFHATMQTERPKEKWPQTCFLWPSSTVQRSTTAVLNKKKKPSNIDFNSLMHFLSKLTEFVNKDAGNRVTCWWFFSDYELFLRSSIASADCNQHINCLYPFLKFVASSCYLFIYLKKKERQVLPLGL